MRITVVSKLLLVLALEATAQTHVLTGRVIDDRRGTGVDAVTVTVFDGEKEVARTLTGPDGSYRIESLPAGTFRITFYQLKYAPRPRKMNVDLNTPQVERIVRLLEDSNEVADARNAFRNFSSELDAERAELYLSVSQEQLEAAVKRGDPESVNAWSKAVMAIGAQAAIRANEGGSNQLQFSAAAAKAEELGRYIDRANRSKEPLIFAKVDATDTAGVDGEPVRVAAAPAAAPGAGLPKTASPVHLAFGVGVLFVCASLVIRVLSFCIRQR